MSTILITGATGFIGRSLVPALISAGHDVRCAVHKKCKSLQAEQVQINKLELQPDWTEALSGIDIVIHLAAKAHSTDKKRDLYPDEYSKVNSIATHHLATQAAKSKVKRFIFLSSIKVNGEFTLENSPFTEESIVQPEDPYAQSKLAAEHYLWDISKITGMQIVIIRPPLVYGPHVKANFLKIMKLVNKGWPLPFGMVHNKRSFIFIDNLVSAICSVLWDARAANQMFLVSDDDSWSLAQLINILANGMDRKATLFSVPIPLLALLFTLTGFKSLNSRLFASLEVSNNKIKSQLGWTPPISSAEGLAKTAKWYQYEYNS
ncbi:NAD-dependent epimerase/dehydratase family protein [Legionella bononiensis]|uniref:NAD-dependent epimerase/dehydratase family protein n=1 Tax=Legionella bononiensis TaxID=2793102 RepID=A0ABS1W7W6_9GAMM|nr:NAD-dependent epimerase/dehydratase family protein [Legionella bononiensis]MBL7525454.1 NAD-dependent epimerase/dehydratase family protein [Legionella bononiensis]MBL7561637.1 NAD-dependent epimerase/dehydratase family protein [Legionella bononiensis]